MKAIFITGGKQYNVSAGDVVYVEKLNASPDDEIKFDQVLMLLDGDKVTIGTPTVSGATVVGKLVKNSKAKKVMIFKFKAKKNYRRRMGHRQPFSKVEITAINA